MPSESVEKMYHVEREESMRANYSQGARVRTALISVLTFIFIMGAHQCFANALSVGLVWLNWNSLTFDGSNPIDIRTINFNHPIMPKVTHVWGTVWGNYNDYYDNTVYDIGGVNGDVAVMGGDGWEAFSKAIPLRGDDNLYVASGSRGLGDYSADAAVAIAGAALLPNPTFSGNLSPSIECTVDQMLWRDGADEVAWNEIQVEMGVDFYDVEGNLVRDYTGSLNYNANLNDPKVDNYFFGNTDTLELKEHVYDNHSAIMAEFRVYVRSWSSSEGLYPHVPDTGSTGLLLCLALMGGILAQIRTRSNVPANPNA
jgi:hypothetical protein